ncbi:hypothetical protein [Allobranchiibius sp. CTAmp26]|uniref:hypothetical protein n=1 Tax=Allobranchiibius sp. CTAmp26 TaxID=2815214 RepID=UPI001AA0BAED|nr:hypothetical protein [Allobranchiibius sp. CTAmp26]MBO1755276.1 hypothetical protein [Allobranchiibius sp. CTAmp26]
MAVSAGLMAGAPTASAAQSCTLSAPARVSVWHSYTGVPLRASGACTIGSGWGAWDLIHPTQGSQDTAFFDGTATDTWDYYTFEPMGRMTWRPSDAYDSYSNMLSQNAPVSEVRLGSWAGLTATRSGSAVTLNVRAVRYWVSGDKNIPFTSAAGTIQYRAPGTTAWKSLKYVSTNSSGAYQYRYASSAARDYRVVLNGTSSIWNAASATVRR